VMQINVMFDRLIAYAFVPEDGANKVLYLGDRLMQLPLGVFAIATATVVFTDMAGCAARGDDRGFLEALQHGLRLIYFTCIPAGVGLIVLGRPVIELLFEHGKFVAADTTRTVWVLNMYAIGLWAFGSVHVVARGFYSLQDTRTPVKIGVAMVFLNLALNLALVQTPLREAGLALATSICSTINFSVLLMILRKRKGRIGLRAVASSAAKIGVAAAVMGLVCLLCLRLIPPATALRGRLIAVFMPMALGAGAFLAAARMLRMRELTELISAFRGRVNVRTS